jgi:hypothetical protein
MERKRQRRGRPNAFAAGSGSKDQKFGSKICLNPWWLLNKNARLFFEWKSLQKQQPISEQPINNMKTIAIVLLRNLLALLCLLFVWLPVRSPALPPPWGTYFGVRINSPANGAVILASAETATANVTIVTETSMENTNGAPTVDRIELFQGTTLIGTIYVEPGPILIAGSGGPYSYAWNNVPVGNYTLTARAYDSTGRVCGSTPVTITVRAAAPQNQTIAAQMLQGTNVVVAIQPVSNLTGVPWQLQSTNDLSIPVANWPVIASGTFSGSTPVFITNAVGTGPNCFYILKMQ